MCGLSKDSNKKKAKFWGCSSVGRAPALQAGGRQFEPDQLHQNKETNRPFGRFFVLLQTQRHPPRNHRPLVSSSLISSIRIQNTDFIGVF